MVTNHSSMAIMFYEGQMMGLDAQTELKNDMRQHLNLVICDIESPEGALLAAHYGIDATSVPTMLIHDINGNLYRLEGQYADASIKKMYMNWLSKRGT